MNALVKSPAPPKSPESLAELTGLERASVVLLALGKKHDGKAVWDSLADDEIRELSVAMSRLGRVRSEHIESLLAEFVLDMGNAGAVVGNYDSTERLLEQFLPDDRVTAIMEEIRGPAGRNMWEKLSNVQETILANYLKNEYPQTIAVVLSKIKPEHASRVLSILPEELALEVVNRMLRMDSVQKEIPDKVEQTLRVEFMSSLAQTTTRDAHESMADIFNCFDQQTESRFLTALEEENQDAADKIRNLMFTFEDLGKLDAASVQTLLRETAKETLAVALKGASETMREFFMSNMLARAGKMLQEDMEVMGPVRLRDVDDAQSQMVNLSKDLAAKGEIMITKDRGDDELIY